MTGQQSQLRSSSAWKLCDVLRALARTPCTSGFFLGWGMIGITTMMVWVASFVQLAQASLSASEAAAFINLFAVVAALGSSIVSPVLGYLLDAMGMRWYVPCVNVFLCVWLFLLGYSGDSYGAQTVALVIGTLGQSGYGAVLMKWLAVAMPPAKMLTNSSSSPKMTNSV